MSFQNIFKIQNTFTYDPTEGNRPPENSYIFIGETLFDLEVEEKEDFHSYIFRSFGPLSKLAVFQPQNSWNLFPKDHYITALRGHGGKMGKQKEK